MNALKKMFGRAWAKPGVRVLVVLLAAVMVFGLIGSVVNKVRLEKAEQEEEEEEEQKKDKDKVDEDTTIIMADCDSADNWVKVNLESSDLSDFVNTDIKTEGSGSVGGKIRSTGFYGATSTFWLHYYRDDAIDITGMTHFVFDMYVEDASKINGAFYTFELGTGSETDTAEKQTHGAKFDGLVDGWNTIEIDLSVLHEVNQYDPFLPECVKRFRLYNGEGPEVYSGLLLFDNFRFIKK